MALKEVEVISKHVIKAMLCGSRVTCLPAPTDTDQDVIVLVRNIESSVCHVVAESMVEAAAQYCDLRNTLQEKGWELGGSGDCEDSFESWTRGDINLILVSDIEFYDRFVAATTVCAELNLMSKEDRRMVFRAVLYSENAYMPAEDGKRFMDVPF